MSVGPFGGEGLRYRGVDQNAEHEPLLPVGEVEDEGVDNTQSPAEQERHIDSRFRELFKDRCFSKGVVTRALKGRCFLCRLFMSKEGKAVEKEKARVGKVAAQVTKAFKRMMAVRSLGQGLAFSNFEQLRDQLNAVEEAAVSDDVARGKLGDLEAKLQELYKLFDVETNAASGSISLMHLERQYDGTSSAVDTVNTVDMAIGSLRAERDSLPPDDPQRAVLNAEIDRLTGIRDGEKLTWVASERYRDVASQHHTGLRGADPVERYVPGAVNLRLHHHEIGGSSLDVVRCGALTDPTAGDTNLGKLEEVSEAYSTRKRNLDLQMLQLLQTHLQSSIKQVESGDSLMKKMWDQGHFCVSHTGLLDPHKRKAPKHGFVHDEGNQMEDTREIFRLFEGKKVVFERRISGPYVDEEGKVHLQWKGEGDPPSYEKTLHTVFGNVSVQGHRKNTGTQLEANRACIASLRSHIELMRSLTTDPNRRAEGGLNRADKIALREEANRLEQRIFDIERRMESISVGQAKKLCSRLVGRGRGDITQEFKRLTDGKGELSRSEFIKLFKEACDEPFSFDEKSLEGQLDRATIKHTLDYEVARDLTLLERDMGISIGGGCFSAKDRSWLFVAMLEQKMHADAGASFWSRRRFAKKLMASDSLHGHVVAQNVRRKIGENPIKIKKINIMGMGWLRRIRTGIAAMRLKS